MESDNAEVLGMENVVESDDCSGMIDGVPIQKLFIGNLAQRTTFNNLRDYFSIYGDVESCQLLRKGRKSYAFITFAKVADAVKAMQDGSRKRLHNRNLIVNAAHSRHQPQSTEQTERKRKWKTKWKTSKKMRKEREKLFSLEQNDTENVSIDI